MKLSSIHIKQWGLAALFTACMLINVFAENPTALYTAANASYKAGDYANAAKVYEQLIAEGYRDATVYYNLANSYYKQNNLGKAILNYERAHKLQPEDEDIAHNLKLANLHVTDKIDAVPQLGIITSWQNFVDSHSAKGWGLFALGSIWLAFVVFAAYLFTDFKKLTAMFGSLLIIFSIAFISLAFTRNNAVGNSNEAILTAASSYVKSAPDDNGTNVFMVHEGVKLSLLDNVGTWYKVRLADGKTGWIERPNFEKI